MSVTANQINGLLENTWQRSGPNVPVAGTTSRSPRYFLPILLAEAGAGDEVVSEWNNLNVRLLPLPPATGLVDVEAQIEVTITALNDAGPDLDTAGIAWGIPYTGTEVIEWTNTVADASASLATALTGSGLIPYLAPLTFSNLQAWGTNADEIASQCKQVVDNAVLLRAATTGGAAPTTLLTSATAVQASTLAANDAIASGNALNEEVTGTTASTLASVTTALDDSTTLIQSILAYINANAGEEIVAGGPFSTLAAWFAAQNP